MKTVTTLVLLSATLTSQPLAQASRTSGWEVKAGPQIDLWFHAMALVGLEGISALPMYEPDHVRSTTAAKRDAGIYPTDLDNEAPKLREDLSKYPSFELMHLIPAYFPKATPERMFDALRRAIDGEDAGAAAPDVALGIAIVGQTFRLSRERNTLRKFVELLETEWSDFYESYWTERETAVLERVAEAQLVVDDLARSPVAARLARWRVQSGTVFLSEPVGLAGRVFLGDPQNPADNVAVVRLPIDSPSPALASGVSLVRELCSPQIIAAVETLRIGEVDRYVADQASGRGAVLCGARLIDSYAPQFSQAYRDSFVETAMGLSAAEFTEVFAVDPALDDWIDRLVGN